MTDRSLSHSNLAIGLIGGTGKEGAGLARRLVQAGYAVTIGSRSIERAETTVDQLRGIAPNRLRAADNRGVIAGCDVLFLCVPFLHAVTTISEHRDQFRPGALLIDVTVPVSFDGGRPNLVDVPEGSATEHIRRHLPERVSLAAALKTIPASLLASSEPLDCDDFVCGSSNEARDRAIAILARIRGLRPIDVGGLEEARTLERMTVLAIRLNRRYKIHGARFRVVGLD